MSAGAVNNTALESNLKCLNAAVTNVKQDLKDGKIDAQTAKFRLDILDRSIRNATSSDIWLPILEVVRDAEGIATGKIERTYNDEGKLLTEKDFSVNDNDLDNVTLNKSTTCTYDEAGNQTSSETLYYWGNEAPQEGNGWEAEYNADGERLVYISKSWNGTELVNNLKEFTEYDSNNQIISTGRALTWDDQNEEWVGGDVYTYAYDSEGRQTLNKNVWAWNGSEYTLGNITEYSYDEAGNTTSYEVSRLNEVNGEYVWVGEEKWEREYNGNGDTTLDISYTWDSESGKWNPSQKQIFDYDSFGNNILMEVYFWENDEWIGSYKNIIAVR